MASKRQNLIFQCSIMEALCWRSVKKTIIFGGIILPLKNACYKKTRFQGPFRDENSLRLNCAITAVVRFRIKSTAPRCCCRRKGRQRASRNQGKSQWRISMVIFTSTNDPTWMETLKNNPVSKRAWGWQWLVMTADGRKMKKWGVHLWNCNAKNGRK